MEKIEIEIAKIGGKWLFSSEITGFQIQNIGFICHIESATSKT